MENNNKSRTNNFIIYILVIVCILFALGGFFFGKRTAETENMFDNTNINNNKPAEIVQPNEEIQPTVEEQNDNNTEQATETQTKPTETIYSLKSAYSYKKSGITYSIYFREDNTYRMDASGESHSHIVGTYEIDANNLTFNPEVLFQGNGCYFVKGAKAVNENVFDTFTIKIEDNKINVPYYDETLKFQYNSKLKEDDDSIKTYSINPTTDTYVDCSDQGKV